MYSNVNAAHSLYKIVYKTTTIKRHSEWTSDSESLWTWCSDPATQTTCQLKSHTDNEPQIKVLSHVSLFIFEISTEYGKIFRLMEAE